MAIDRIQIELAHHAHQGLNLVGEFSYLGWLVVTKLKILNQVNNQVKNLSFFSTWLVKLVVNLVVKLVVTSLIIFLNSDLQKYR